MRDIQLFTRVKLNKNTIFYINHSSKLESEIVIISMDSGKNTMIRITNDYADLFHKILTNPENFSELIEFEMKLISNDSIEHFLKNIQFIVLTLIQHDLISADSDSTALDSQDLGSYNFTTILRVNSGKNKNEIENYRGSINTSTLSDKTLEASAHNFNALDTGSRCENGRWHSWSGGQYRDSVPYTTC